MHTGVGMVLSTTEAIIPNHTTDKNPPSDCQAAREALSCRVYHGCRRSKQSFVDLRLVHGNEESNFICFLFVSHSFRKKKAIK